MIVNWIHGLVSVWLDMKVGNISFDQIISFSPRLATIQTVSNVPTNREEGLLLSASKTVRISPQVPRRVEPSVSIDKVTPASSGSSNISAIFSTIWSI